MVVIHFHSFGSFLEIHGTFSQGHVQGGHWSRGAKTPEYKSEATMSASAPLAAKGNNNGEAGPMSPTKFHKMANGQQKMRRFLEEW